jgi:uncharacterized membrane protein YqjE
VKVHRAVILLALIIASLALLTLMTWGALRNADARSLAALAVAIVLAAIGGIAFSWRRYFPRGG